MVRNDPKRVELADVRVPERLVFTNLTDLMGSSSAQPRLRLRHSETAVHRLRYLSADYGRCESPANPVQLNSRSPGPAGAERIPGSMLLREVEADDFPDTGPDIDPVSTEPQANSVSLTPVAS